MSGGQPGYRTVRLACDGGVATITLNRPQKRNPLSAETAEELMHADIRLASEEARIGAAFIRRGSSAADMGVSYILPGLVGHFSRRLRA